jgi:hypothetical protein
MKGDRATSALCHTLPRATSPFLPALLPHPYPPLGSRVPGHPLPPAMGLYRGMYLCTHMAGGWLGYVTEGQGLGIPHHWALMVGQAGKGGGCRKSWPVVTSARQMWLGARYERAL